MVCKNCAGKPVARGISVFQCNICGEQGNNYVNGIRICGECRERYNLCPLCGEKVVVLPDEKPDEVFSFLRVPLFTWKDFYHRSIGMTSYTGVKFLSPYLPELYGKDIMVYIAPTGKMEVYESPSTSKILSPQLVWDGYPTDLPEFLRRVSRSAAQV